MRELSKAEIIVRNRKIMLVTAVAISVILSFIFFSSISQADNSREVYTYYTSYEIQSGDTLWSIADKYMNTEDSDKAEFISTVKKNNHMLDDDIKAGDRLIIEYKSYEKL